MRLTPKLCIFLALAFLVGCNGEIRDFDLHQFQNGAIVGTHNPNKERDEICVKTSTGVNAKVIFLSHNSIFIKFEDEKAERKICVAGWIVASEVRQLLEKDLLFIQIKSSDLTKHNEWQNNKKIFVYELLTRKLTGWARND